MHNFGSIRSELDDIKQEFLQQESAIVDKNSNLLQLNSEESENQLASIQERLVSKER